MVRVIDMHNHLVAPEVVAFLAREGAHYNTRIIEEDGQRFFIIQDTARRPLHAKISQVEARGHTVTLVDLTSGLSAILKTENGYAGGADPRREGTVKGY